MVRYAWCLALALAGAALPAAGQIKIGGPTLTGPIQPQPKTPAQLAQEREAQAVKAWREERLEEKLRSMGRHRELEARRQVEMEEAARRARGLGFAPAAGTAATSTPATASARACRDVDDGMHKSWHRAPKRSSADTTARGKAGAMCRARGGTTGLAMQCKQHHETRRVPVPGNPLKFKKEPAGTSWECLATFRCAQPRQVCEGGTTGVRQ